MGLNRWIVKITLLGVAAGGVLRGQTAATAGPNGDATTAGAAFAAAAEDEGAKSASGIKPASAKPVETGYAGNTQCKTCHADIWSNFYKNPHFKSLASGKEPPERTACEGCHGPAKAHIEAGGGRNTIPHAFTTMKPREVIDACLKCHANDFSRANIRRSEHTQHDVACTACHSNHHPTTPKYLLAKSQPEACYQCHGDVRSQFDLPSRHRVNEGLMQCSDCHNPHGGFAPAFAMGQTSKMLNQAHGNEQPCLKCHVDKRGPFIFEHGPGEVEGCITCHRPHGTTNAKLLVRTTVAQLCLECHTATGDFGAKNRAGIKVPDAATHSLLDPTYQQCTHCHQKIHGSNVHYRFLR